MNTLKLIWAAYNLKKGEPMNLFKKEPEPIEIFDRLILEEEYAKAFAFAIDNKIEQEALKICIQYIQSDDESSNDNFFTQGYDVEFVPTKPPDGVTVSNEIQIIWEEVKERRCVLESIEKFNQYFAENKLINNDFHYKGFGKYLVGHPEK